MSVKTYQLEQKKNIYSFLYTYETNLNSEKVFNSKTKLRVTHALTILSFLYSIKQYQTKISDHNKNKHKHKNKFTFFCFFFNRKIKSSKATIVKCEEIKIISNKK